ncbi:shufflon system plasmid conjugative transfer pilus tip adhesin PilV (plasmid) [Burkholderia aenigmatica]|uniref:shufflon system plasmid conjugative transfer pilus tip adhesin PilV n=1 Tax=Burkholderia aenigmatica TaxID=2015348 RepID=UPI001F194C58|nr:shufflon system plasmid conjugative transfer pilus tip adhesin PilV [Burkholderia aenigmatica]UKD18093.1 shufflon system plasmid conjugative transfer pilus tip adhesin PilV [Burkholderia aenigmatica]
MGEMLGSLAGTLMWLMMASVLFAWLQRSTDAIQVAGAANQAQVMGAALGRYVKDHGADLAAIATPTQPANVTVSDLQAGGYLPSGMSTANVFRQQWAAQVLQPQPGKLQTMLFTTGGMAIPPQKLVPLASQSSGRGNLGGFVPYANQAGDATMQPTVAIGAGGTFRQSLAGYANPGSGHLAMMVGVGDAPSDNGYLYRVDMKPGRPDLNAMQTDLSMTDTQGNAHDINGANAVNANKFQLPSGGGMNNDQGGALELGAGNGTAGTGVPYIDFHLGGKGVQDFNARLQNDGDNHLVVAGADGKGSLGVQGTLQAGNIATPGTSCSPNGVMAANSDGSGQMLSCQYGTWMPIGGRWLRYGYYTVMDAWWVPAPTCPNGGAMKVQVTLQNFSVNNTATVNSGPATWTGNGWTVHLTDGNGYGIPGAQGIAATYCAY